MNEHPQEHIKYYWEDLPVGLTQQLGSLTVEREEVLEFARKYDPQPFHLSDQAAAQTHFGRLAASGWHTCAMTMGLMVRSFLHEAAGLGAPGLEKVKWPRPVYPGDTLTLHHRIVESRPLKSRPDAGLVRSHWEMFNQHGQQVLLIDSYGMFRRRTPGI